MIDFISITTPALNEDKINHIVWRNGLKTNSKDGEVFYDNSTIKNLTQQKGIYIKIETDGRLKMEGSLHKYYNETSGYDRNNCNMFTMSQAKEAIGRLMHDKGVDMKDAFVQNCEIGLNLNISKDCQTYLEKLKSIGAVGDEREFLINPKYVNPRHKNIRLKVTGFKKVRKHYKAYDKVTECLEKKRKVIPVGNILRIETVYNRMEKCKLMGFFSSDNLQKLVENFFREWHTVQFERCIITPKGTGRARQNLCTEIMNTGREKVLKHAKDRHKSGSLSDWEYRNIREFINNEWDEVKKQITFIQSDEEVEFRQLMQENYTILRHDKI